MAEVVGFFDEFSEDDFDDAFAPKSVEFLHPVEGAVFDAYGNAMELFREGVEVFDSRGVPEADLDGSFAQRWYYDQASDAIMWADGVTGVSYPESKDDIRFLYRDMAAGDVKVLTHTDYADFVADRQGISHVRSANAQFDAESDGYVYKRPDNAVTFVTDEIRPLMSPDGETSYGDEMCIGGFPFRMASDTHAEVYVPNPAVHGSKLESGEPRGREGDEYLFDFDPDSSYMVSMRLDEHTLDSFDEAMDVSSLPVEGEPGMFNAMWRMSGAEVIDNIIYKDAGRVWNFSIDDPEPTLESGGEEHVVPEDGFGTSSSSFSGEELGFNTMRSNMSLNVLDDNDSALGL